MLDVYSEFDKGKPKLFILNGCLYTGICVGGEGHFFYIETTNRIKGKEVHTVHISRIAYACNEPDDVLEEFKESFIAEPTE